jgi:hypothetical protein
VEDTAEAIASVHVEPGNSGGFCNRFGQWVLWSGVGNTSMRPMRIVMLLVLVQGVEEVGLVVNQHAVE